jgi:hypothetical protein
LFFVAAPRIEKIVEGIKIEKFSNERQMLSTTVIWNYSGS